MLFLAYNTINKNQTSYWFTQNKKEIIIMDKIFKQLLDSLENITEEEFADVFETPDCQKRKEQKRNANCDTSNICNKKTTHRKARIPFCAEDVVMIPKGVCFDFKKMISRVIFQDPATIVFWKDGTKTVVKTQGNEKFDKEKGLAMCIVKYMFGNTGMYYEVFKKHCQ